MRLELDTHGAEQTVALGERFGWLLRAGDVGLLFGSLGAGKTTFVRGVARALGVDASLVASPTYVVMHEYPGSRLNLIHADAYRLSGPEDLDSLGWDLAIRDDCATIIEWPERIAGGVDLTVAARVTFTPTGETSRRVSLELPETWRVREGITKLGAPLDTTCPVTGVRVPADSPTWPFASETARLADLNRWFSGQYVVSRDLGESDEEDEA